MTQNAQQWTRNNVTRVTQVLAQEQDTLTAATVIGRPLDHNDGSCNEHLKQGRNIRDTGANRRRKIWEQQERSNRLSTCTRSLEASTQHQFQLRIQTQGFSLKVSNVVPTKTQGPNTFGWHRSCCSCCTCHCLCCYHCNCYQEIKRYGRMWGCRTDQWGIHKHE